MEGAINITTPEQWLHIRMEAFALGLLRYHDLSAADRALVDQHAKRVLMGGIKDSAAARRGIAAVLYATKEGGWRDPLV